MYILCFICALVLQYCDEHHQDDDCFISKYWEAILKQLSVETKSVIV